MTTTPPNINQRIFAGIRAAARTRSICADYARYEAQKSIWASQHPGATPDEYARAVQAIARDCGV